jgi:Proteobacterial lipase chaperone protein
MSKRNALLIASLAALAVSGGFLAFRSEAPDPAQAQIGPAPTESRAVAGAPAAHPGAQPPQPASEEAGATPGEAATEYNAEQDDGQVAFKADASGRIVLNEKTRLDLERLHALYTPPERERKMTEIAATLPPEAAQKLYQLMEQYQNYMAALHQVFPPDREMTSVEQGVAQIDGMHGLRVQYFGEPATAAMFGAEEKLQRELYQQMENEKDPSLTLEEKAERAQRIYEAQHPR